MQMVQCAGAGAGVFEFSRVRFHLRRKRMQYIIVDTFYKVIKYGTIIFVLTGIPACSIWAVFGKEESE